MADKKKLEIKPAYKESQWNQQIFVRDCQRQFITSLVYFKLPKSSTNFADVLHWACFYTDEANWGQDEIDEAPVRCAEVSAYKESQWNPLFFVRDFRR